MWELQGCEKNKRLWEKVDLLNSCKIIIYAQVLSLIAKLNCEGMAVHYCEEFCVETSVMTL